MARVSAVILILVSGAEAQSSFERTRSLRGSENNALKSSRKGSFRFSECFAADSGFDQPPILNSSDFDSLLLPAPDLNGTIEDLAILKFSQESRSPETCNAQRGFLSCYNIFAYNAAIGANIEDVAPTFSECIVTLFSESLKDVKDHFKNKIQRPRPFLRHPDLKPCIPKEFSYSYPSGHATFYSFTAELLTAVYPELEERLKQVGSRGVYARVIGGVHYPSDVEAGRKLGQSAAAKIMKTSLWNAFLSTPGEKVTKELAAIQLLQPTVGSR